MKTRRILNPIIYSILFYSYTVLAQEIPTDSIYFGCIPPGDSAIIFAPGIISLPGRFERTPNYYPDNKEFYFTVIHPQYHWQRGYSTRYTDQWAVPEEDTSFNELTADLSINNDGTKLQFTSNDGNYIPGTHTWSDIEFWDNDVWVCDRIDTGWSEPYRISDIINTHPTGEWGPCLLNNGNLYFCRPGSDGNGNLYFSRFENEQYQNPVYLSELNTNSHEWDPFVPEDESYIIFKSNRSGGYGNLDLYISYKRANGSWADPINLGSRINSPFHDDCGNLTPDGKYFIFARRNGDVEMDFYWVSSDFIEELKPADLNAYLGQNPPGDTPEIFAEDILSKNNRQERVLAFTPDYREIYFTVVNASNNYTILFFEEIDGQWQEEKTPAFITEYMSGANCVEPFISPDGTKLLFSSKKDATGGDWDYNIWITEKEGDSWGEPEMLGSSINTNAGEWHPCITRNNNIYFARDGNIYFSEYSEDTYTQAVKVTSINSSSQDWDPYVDPDEKYLIFKSNRPGGYGKMDNYISLRDTISNSWSEAYNLGNVINSDGVDDAGDVSPDGKYFFYSRTNDEGEMDVYWIDAEIIHQFNPTGINESREKIPGDFRLNQNFPNPFNSNTVIEYHLPDPDYIHLQIYNIIGQKVATLVDGYQTAGEHRVEWHAKGTASGVYLYRIQAGNFSETKKFIHQK